MTPNANWEMETFAQPHLTYSSQLKLTHSMYFIKTSKCEQNFCLVKFARGATVKRFEQLPAEYEGLGSTPTFSN